MAVVKKLQSGGTAISNPFEEYVYQDLTSGALSKNSLDKVKPVAKQWSELYKYVETSDKPLEEFIKFDRIGETYEINTESLPEELKKYNWTGYKKKPSKNFLGKYSINDEMSANDYYGSLFLKYIVDKGTPVKTNKVKETRDIPVLQNYILTSQFGNEKNNESLFEETWSKLSSDQKKERVINSAKENIKLYLEDYSKNSNVHDYKNIETVRKINEYLDNGDIEGFIKESNKLGWDPNSLMLSEESTTSTPETTQVESNPEEIKQKAVNTFVESGLTPELAEKLTEAGYNIDWNYNPSNQEWFPQYLKEQKAVPVKSPTGSYSILKGSGVFDARMINPTQGDRYGHYWSHDADWNINYSAPGTDQWSSEGYHDPLFGKRGMREINATLPINFSGWKTYGISDSKYKDSLGFTDYTKHLLIEDPNKTQSLELWWDSSKNTYIDQFGKPFSSLKINQYSGSPQEWGTFENVQDEFSNIPAKNYGLVTIPEIRKKLKEVLPVNESGIRDINRKNKEQVAQIIAQLKHILNTSNNRLEWENAYGLYSELTGIIKPDTFKKLNNLNTNLINPNKFLKGGVIKAQSGTKLTPDEYIKKYAKTSSDSKNNSSDLNIRDTTGTLRDMDFADWGSLGSSVVSFVPVLGALGGLSATGFDVYRDIRDGKNVLPNLATNLAFTGLSLIGLGGLKSLKLAGQGVKVLNTTKATKNLVKLSKTGVDIKELKGSLQLIKEAEKIAKTSKIPLKEATIQVLKLSDDVSDVTTLANKADVLLGAVSKLEKIPPSTLVGKALISPTVAKTGKNLATGALLTTSVGSGVKAGINIAGDIQEGGIGNINPEDLKSVALLGSIGSQTAVNRYGKSKISKFTKPTEVKSASYEAKIKTDAGDVNINISDLPNKEFHFKNLLNLKVKKPSEESLNLLKDDLIKKGIDETSALKFIEQYKVKGDKLFTFIPEKKSGIELITDIEKIMQDPSGYNRAKRILEKNFAPSGSPVYLWREGSKATFSFTDTNLLDEAPVIRKRPVKIYNEVKKVNKRTNSSLNYTSFPNSNEVVKDPTIVKSPLMASKPVVLSTSSVTPNLDIKWKPLSSIDPLMTKNNDKLMAMKKIKPERMSFKDRKAYNSAIKEDLSLEKTTDASGFAGLTSKTNLNKIGQYVNPAMVANTLGLGANIIGNKRAADFYKKGVIEGIYRDPSIPHRFTRVSSDIDIPYNKRITDAKLQTKNLSEITSDSDASRGIALEGLRIQNQIATERDINKHRDILQQRGIAEANTTEVDRINTQIYAGNKARAAAGRQNLMNIEGGRQASNSQAIQNYIKGMTHAVGEAKKERADNKLFDYMQSDDVKNTYNDVKNISQKEQAIRDKWNTYLESPEGRYAKEGNSTIESFPEYQQFLIEKNATIKNYENVNKMLERLRFNTSGRYLYSKNGGKLNTLSLEAIKELNKKILNDNKLLQKMLNRYESKYK